MQEVKLVTHEEKLKLIHALMKASNAFSSALEADGFHLSHGLTDEYPRKFGIYTSAKNPEWVGDFIMGWELRREDATAETH